jgi:hypothetical protein
MLRGFSRRLKRLKLSRRLKKSLKYLTVGLPILSGQYLDSCLFFSDWPMISARHWWNSQTVLSTGSARFSNHGHPIIPLSKLLRQPHWNGQRPVMGACFGVVRIIVSLGIIAWSGPQVAAYTSGFDCICDLQLLHNISMYIPRSTPRKWAPYITGWTVERSRLVDWHQMITDSVATRLSQMRLQIITLHRIWSYSFNNRLCH